MGVGERGDAPGQRGADPGVERGAVARGGGPGRRVGVVGDVPAATRAGHLGAGTAGGGPRRLRGRPDPVRSGRRHDPRVSAVGVGRSGVGAGDQQCRPGPSSPVQFRVADRRRAAVTAAAVPRPGVRRGVAPGDLHPCPPGAGRRDRRPVRGRHDVGRAGLPVGDGRAAGPAVGVGVGGAGVGQDDGVAGDWRSAYPAGHADGDGGDRLRARPGRPGSAVGAGDAGPAAGDDEGSWDQLRRSDAGDVAHRGPM